MLMNIKVAVFGGAFMLGIIMFGLVFAYIGIRMVLNFIVMSIYKVIPEGNAKMKLKYRFEIIEW